HLAPYLVEVNRGHDVEALLHIPQIPQQGWRAHVWRPGCQPDPDAPVIFAVPTCMEIRDAGEPLLSQRRVDCKRPRLADRGVFPVPGALAQKEAQTTRLQRLGIALDGHGIFEDQRSAAAYRLHDAELTHDLVFFSTQSRQRQRCQAALERRLMRWR